jgi:hypothetical protein
MIGKRAKRCEIGGFEACAVGVDDRKFAMAVGGGAAVAGDMLEHRQHAARHEPIGDAARQRRDLVRYLAIGAVADDAVGAVDRHIGQRQAIHVDAHGLKIARDQPRAEPGRPLAGRL